MLFSESYIVKGEKINDNVYRTKIGTLVSRPMDTVSICYKVSRNKREIFDEARKVLDFLNLQSRLEEKARVFAEKGRYDSALAFNGIIEFLQLQKERFNRKEITAGTIRNYVKSIKLFCLMADISIPWDKITRGLPRGRRYAYDRAPILTKLKN